MPEPEPSAASGSAQRAGLLVGAGAFVLLLLIPAPGGLSPEGWRTAAVAALMAIWWVTEAVPIPATALLPLVLFPGLGILSMADASAPYANDLIFLFMGGFFLAAAMERWGLHRRLALGIVAAIGTGPRRIILGFMCACAFLSMWISNTATAAMMLPIVVALAELLRPEPSGPGGGSHAFAVALMLGVAYGSTIGGVATLIGTPPNAVFAGAANELLATDIGFLQWMTVGVPFALILLPAAWLLLVWVLHPPGTLTGDAESVIRSERAALGPLGRGERIVGAVFLLAAVSWMLRAPKDFGAFTLPGIQTYMPAVRDSTIAIAASMLLFVAPVDWKKGEFALDWERARRIPWGVLVLFGGGLSLARAMDQSGLAAWIGNAVVGLANVPVVVIVGVVAALFVFLTEITSNTATSTMAMPIMAGAAVGLGMEPITLMAVAALASSMAFMLPVATPPNAIVFGSGHLTIGQMVRAGLWLNLMAIVLLAMLGPLLLPLLTG